MIVYPFILLNRMRGRQHTWSWSKCTAVHNSMAAYTMSTDFGMYLAGYPVLGPIICFILCRITLLLESVLPILIHFVPFDVVKMLILVILSGMQFGFNVFIRVENFGWSMATSMVLFLPPFFWEKVEATRSFRKWSMWLRGWMVFGARTFKTFENLSTLYGAPTNQLNVDNMETTQRSLLWEIPLISEEEQQHSDRIEVNKSIGLLTPIPTKLNRVLSCFFLVYLMINNLGDVQLRLFPKPVELT